MATTEQQIAKLTDRIGKSLKELGKDRVLVGVPESKAARDDPSANNAYLAAIHENGSAARGIPARPFLRPGVNKAQPQILKILEKACVDKIWDAVFERGDNSRRALSAIGIIAQNSVRKMFTNNDWPKLSDLTIAGLKKKDGTYLWEGRKKKTKKMQADFDKAMATLEEATANLNSSIASFYEDVGKAYEDVATHALDPVRDQYRPLIDTGQLRKSISYVIVDASEVKD
jgi:hypothetical protein